MVRAVNQLAPAKQACLCDEESFMDIKNIKPGTHQTPLTKPEAAAILAAGLVRHAHALSPVSNIISYQ